MSRKVSSPESKEKPTTGSSPPIVASSPTTAASSSHPSQSSLDGHLTSGPGRPAVTSPTSTTAPRPTTTNQGNLKCDETASSASPSAPSAPSLSPALAAADPTCVAARCRPVKSYRRRKLLRMSGLHNLSRKAARPVTLSCSCWPPSATHQGGHSYRYGMCMDCI